MELTKKETKRLRKFFEEWQDCDLDFADEGSEIDNLWQGALWGYQLAKEDKPHD